MKRQKYFNGEEKVALKRLIEEKTGYCIRSSSVLAQAFRRRSFCVESEEGGKSNEMFELIGDQVLSYHVVKAIAERCISMNFEGDYSFRIKEKHVTHLKQEIVSNESLAAIIDEWGIAEYLIVGKSDEQNQVDQQTKVKADLFESIIGAIAVDSKWDSAVLEETVKRGLNLDQRLQSIIQNTYYSLAIIMDNAVSKLKELAEQELCSMPVYETMGPEHLGYDQNGNPQWHCSCFITNDITSISRGVFASSKKNAKKAAAYLVLCEQLQIQNQYGVSRFYPTWTYENGKLAPYQSEWEKNRETK